MSNCPLLFHCSCSKNVVIPLLQFNKKYHLSVQNIYSFQIKEIVVPFPSPEGHFSVNPKTQFLLFLFHHFLSKEEFCERCYMHKATVIHIEVHPNYFLKQ